MQWLIVVLLHLWLGQPGSPTALPIAAPPTPASTSADPRIVPISGPLGLADIQFADAADIQSAAVLLDLPAPIRVPMFRRDAAGTQLWTARVRAGLPAFSFRIELNTAAGLITRGPFAAGAEPIADDQTPDWAKGAVWYQIFPERFRNGNPGNDPHTLDTDLRPWDEPWRALTTDQVELAWARIEDARALGLSGAPSRREIAPWLRSARRHGGDLHGVMQRFDYLRELGIDALYLNPIFRARSSHKYEASDYRHIDESFAAPGRSASNPGPAETADPATWTRTPSDEWFQDVFLPSAHRAGLRVVLDGVWNHVGRDFWAFQDAIKRGKASPFAGWFDLTFATGNVESDGGEFPPGSVIGWRAWDRRNGGLPSFARSAESGFPAPVTEHLFAVTRRWMNPDGPTDRRIDGWRLDVAPDVPRVFWKAWRQLVKKINPDAVLIGEVWFPARTFFHGAAFDAQMNYPFAVAALRFLLADPQMDATALGQTLTSLEVSPAIDLVQQNLLGSHDTARLATMLFDPRTGYEDLPRTGARRGPSRDARPDADAFRRARLAVSLQVAAPGAPMVYYGDEVGLFGANDPDCRKPFPWADLVPLSAEDTAIQTAMHAHWRAWLRLRSQDPTAAALRLGSAAYPESGDPNVFAVIRSLNADAVLIIINRDADAPFDAAPLLARFGDGWSPILPGRADAQVLPLEARCWSLVASR